jgi:hypothetical protein
MANSSINLVDLDFFSIKSSLKNYLRNQEVFKDYNFDGSGMGVMLDLLAHNTFKNSFYTNMLISESFIDTAQLRGSLISHAKELNYTPRSARSAKARIRMTFEATGDNHPYIIGKGQSFSAIVKNNNFTFTLPETISVASANNTFSFEADIYEGVYVQDTYVFRQTGETIPRFRLTNRNADTDSLSVVVYDDNNLEGKVYTQTNSLLDLNFADQVFFLQCDENEYYEIYFGDDVLGTKPKNLSTVVLDYRLASGPLADGALEFVPNFNPTGQNNELLASVNIETIDVSRGGAEVETTESIRYYAPRAFQVQERTVTASDYEIALKTQFPEINAVFAYGGEDVNPPQFGKVFVAVDISNVDGFPDSKKRQYLNFIKRRAPFSIEPVFIDPEFSYLSVHSLIRYNVNVTKVDSNTIRTLIVNTIADYRDRELDDFNVTFRASKLANSIDDADVSIVSSSMIARLYKKFDLIPGVQHDISLDYKCALVNNIPVRGDIHPSTDIHAFQSSPFKFRGLICSFEDDGNGNIRLISTDSVTDSKITNVGTINYDTGKVALKNILIDTFLGSAVKFYARPQDLDIQAITNTILTIEDSEINVTVEQLRE